MSATDPHTQEHCPTCGLSRLAVTSTVNQPDGSWKCSKCVSRGAAGPPHGEQMTTVTCPTCRDSGAPCVTCAGMGKVRVPLSKLNVYDPAAPQVLTEG